MKYDGKPESWNNRIESSITLDYNVDMEDILIKQIRELLTDNVIGSLANVAAAIFYGLENLNWVGYYFYKEGYLELGPFQGRVACVRLTIDRGVCAKAFRDNNTVCVADVHTFPGHIACDSSSESELVVPLRINGDPIGVLDIDAPIKDRFSTDDINIIEAIGEVLSEYLSEAWPNSKVS